MYFVTIHESATSTTFLLLPPVTTAENSEAEKDKENARERETVNE
jgi:hypothetical protein